MGDLEARDNSMGEDLERSSCEKELLEWKIIALGLMGLIVAFVFVRSFMLWHVYKKQRKNKEDHHGYAALNDDGEAGGEFSDSISESSSLFSPPFRPNEGIDFRRAAANVSHTELYLLTSASTDQLQALEQAGRASQAPTPTNRDGQQVGYILHNQQRPAENEADSHTN
mmetsp:Transcript_3334/g.7474  ORF Transcript_3334/g.7474 Transcript_3334/m.7474 type:complete len:169 (+) Transcript_3334:352-858(+)